MKKVISVLIFSICFVELVFADALKRLNYQNNRYNRVVQKKRDAIGKLGGKDVVLGKISLNKTSNSHTPPKNGCMLKNVTDEMSKYPLVVSDSGNGLFVTDWMPLNNLNMRRKISVRLSEEDKNVNVTVFRQVKDKSGDWVAIDDDKNFEKEVEKSIINKKNN